MIHKETVVKSYKRILNSKRISGKLVNRKVEHQCCYEFCRPENEVMLINDGELSAPPVTTQLYVCKYSQSHYCTAETCDKHVQGVCPVSGIVYGPEGYSSYDKNDARTWYAPDSDVILVKEQVCIKKKRRIVKRRVKDETVHSLFDDIIIALLYSPMRKTLNDRARQDALKERQKACNIYRQECFLNNLPVNLTHLKIIQSNVSYVVMNELEFEWRRVYYYRDILMHVYKLWRQYVAQNEPQKHLLRKLALGTLYSMWKGIERDDITYLARDQFLVDNLPMINDLPAFNIDKRQITEGEKLVDITFSLALDQGASPAELFHNVILAKEEIRFLPSIARRKK